MEHRGQRELDSGKKNQVNRYLHGIILEALAGRRRFFFYYSMELNETKWGDSCIFGQITMYSRKQSLTGKNCLGAFQVLKTKSISPSHLLPSVGEMEGDVWTATREV
jgi:hypothetical protein